MSNKFELLIKETLALPAPVIDNPVLIYGAGNKGREIAPFLIERGYGISAFLDQNARPGQNIGGIPVFTLDDWLGTHNPGNYSLVVAIFNHLVNLPALLDTLRAALFRQVLSIIDLYNAMPGDLPDILWLTDRSVYRPFGAELDRLDSLLSDEESHIWLESVVRFRLSENYALPSPGLTDPYHPRHLPAWQTPLRFIDCGAFDGDTLRHFTKNGYDFAAIAAFEPDMDNFQRLSETVRYYENVVCFPCAVGASTEIVRFNASSNTSSHISANSVEGTPVQCVRLDEALPTFAPNLIKMDIEGAELDALNGARGIITKYRPGLAICLYHIPEHLWQIPLLLHNWNLGYRFYIRGHCHNSFELVFYAIPEQQI